MMKIDYDPADPLFFGYYIWDTDILTLLRVGRKFQDWLDGLGRFGGFVTVTLVTYFEDGYVSVHIDTGALERIQVTEKDLKTIKNKLYDIAVGAEWNPHTEELKAAMYRMMQPGARLEL